MSEEPNSKWQPPPQGLGGFKLFRPPLQPGQCPECIKVHPPELPHNAQSFFYQYSFMEKHGRWPTWKDAMEHCTPEIKEAWTEGLAAEGVTI